MLCVAAPVDAIPPRIFSSPFLCRAGPCFTVPLLNMSGPSMQRRCCAFLRTSILRLYRTPRCLAPPIQRHVLPIPCLYNAPPRLRTTSPSLSLPVLGFTLLSLCHTCQRLDLPQRRIAKPRHALPTLFFSKPMPSSLCRRLTTPYFAGTARLAAMLFQCFDMPSSALQFHCSALTSSALPLQVPIYSMPYLHQG